MKWSDAFAVGLFMVCVTALLGVAVPGCIQKKRAAIVECSQKHSPAECYQALPQ